MKRLQNEYKVSVLIPCFNVAHTVRKCVGSVVTQTYQAHEILMFDDKSTDDTADILTELTALHPSIRILENPKTDNVGAGLARSALIAAATGNVIAFLDADDFWYPHKLELQLSLMHAHKADIVTGGYEIIDSRGRLLGSRFAPSRITYPMMLVCNWLPTSMTILRRSLKYSEAMPSIRRRQDYAYWLKLFRYNENLVCVSVPESVGGYSRGGTGLSSSYRKNLQANFTMFRNEMNFNIAVCLLLLVSNIVFRLFRR